MDTVDFLRRVLPPEGFYVATIINSGEPPKQGFFKTVDDLAEAVLRSDRLGNNTYYAISSYREKGSRKQENVLGTRVFAFDIDCGEGKPYDNWKAALVALGQYAVAAQMPRPMIVHSGKGLHVYWVCEETLEPRRWRPVAAALKASAAAHGLHIDPVVTTDIARVLRPVGTRNPKNDATVRLLIDAPAIPLDTLTQRLIDFYQPEPPQTGRPAASALASALVVDQEFPPAAAGVVVARCKQVKWAVENQGEVDEPLWYALLGVAAYCHDADATGLAWSERHPEYDPSRTLAKLRQWKQATTGPTTCQRFAELRPTGCAGCKFKGSIGTPARLGVQYQEVAPAATAPRAAHTDVPLPRGFKRTTRGIVLTVSDTDVEVSPYDLYPASYGVDETLGYEVVRYYWNRPHMGWQELKLRQADLTGPRLKDFTTNIADRGIVLSSEKQTEYFQMLLRAYMDELRKVRAMTNLYATMGWKENFSQFVIGNTVMRRTPDGSVETEEVALASTAARLGMDLWETSGDREAWTAFTSVLEKTDMMAQMFALSVGFSAPLYAFTGLKGLTVSLYGPTGGGKSLAQMWVQSIFGNPEKLHFAAKFTQNTLFGRMGLYAHMPMTIDEVTMMDDREVGDFAYWVSQGRDKARMNRNAEERDAKTWALPVIVSTNKSLSSKLIASNTDTDAQIARILEVTVPPHRLFAKDSSAGRRVYEFITGNYGHVGREFVRRLLEMGEDGIRAAIAEANATFARRYKCQFAGQERFWEQAVVLADLAARLAHGWGLIAFTPERGIEWVLEQITGTRKTVAENKADAFDVLAEYLNEEASAQVQVFHTGGQKPLMDYSRVPRGEIRVRFDFYRKSNTDPITAGTLLIDRTHFRRWLSARGADYRTFVNELIVEGVLATPKSNKAYLGKDTPVKLGQSYVVGVNLNHPRLQGMLTDADCAIDDLLLGQVKAV